MLTNQSKTILSSQMVNIKYSTEGGGYSPVSTTAKENQQPPSNPKANWRLTAFFTLRINDHVC